VETRQEVQGLAVLETEQITTLLPDLGLQTQATVVAVVDMHLVVLKAVQVEKVL
jgi:hypothetical protein